MNLLRQYRGECNPPSLRSAVQWWWEGGGATSFGNLPFDLAKQYPMYHPKGSFPFIAKPNSKARCENFHPSTILKDPLRAWEMGFAISGKEV